MTYRGGRRTAAILHLLSALPHSLVRGCCRTFCDAIGAVPRCCKRCHQRRRLQSLAVRGSTTEKTSPVSSSSPDPDHWTSVEIFQNRLFWWTCEFSGCGTRPPVLDLTAPRLMHTGSYRFQVRSHQSILSNHPLFPHGAVRRTKDTQEIRFRNWLQLASCTSESDGGTPHVGMIAVPPAVLNPTMYTVRRHLPMPHGTLLARVFSHGDSN